MPPLSFIIAAVMFLLVMYFFYTFFKKVFRVLLTVNIILFAFMGIVFYFIISDINEMKANIDTSRLYVFAQDNNALSAFTVKGNETLIIDEEQLKAISSRLPSNDLANIIGKNNMLFIYKSNLIENTNFKLEFTGKSLNSQEALEILNSSTDKNLKAFIFANIVNTYTSQGSYIIKGLKKKDIIIYPETFTFRILRFIENFE